MDKESIKSCIEVELAKLLTGQGALYEASNHAAFPAGKRLRPLISLHVTEDLGSNPGKFVPAACALELLHTSSLIHDDLPCMDNDDFRRGRPTVHKAFGESTALLAGDFLIAKAFDAIFSCPALSKEQKASLCESLSSAYRKLCEGQELDLQTEKDIEKIKRIHSLKTGALFRATCEFGAVFADVTSEKFEFLARVGEEFGILFQVLDDYLDVFGDPALRGRPKGSDEKNQKETFFTLHSHQDARIHVEQLTESFLALLHSAPKVLGVELVTSRAFLVSVLEPLIA